MNSSEGKEIYLKKDIDFSIQFVNNFISSLIQDTNNQFSSLVGDKPLMRTIIQVLHDTKLNNSCQRSVLSIILNHAFLAEKISPGSFEETIKIISKSLSGKNEDTSNDEVLFAKRPTKEHIKSFLRSKSNDSKFLSTITDALSLAGYGGKIIVEKSVSGTVSVELCRGYTFNVSPAWAINAKFDSPKVVVIDGYVENVSEIHHLLEAASERKDTIIIFSRGMSADVIHTLKVNYDRGTLKVVPVIVKFDLEGINTVNDVSVVTGCDMVSSRKGDLISSIKYDSLPIVDYTFVYPNKVVIQNQKTYLDVEAQVRSLRNKQVESGIDDVSDLLEKRIRSLSPNHVVIRIPDDKDYVKNSQFIDTSLRSIRSIIDHGIHDSDGIVQPATVMVTSKIYAKKCIDVLSNVGSVIT